MTSFLLDPETGQAQDLPDGHFLRPIVDPTGAWVLYWDGTVVSDGQGVDWMPGTGRLMVAPWAPALPIKAVPGAVPGASASPRASAGPTTSPGPDGSGRPVLATTAPTPSTIPSASATSSVPPVPGDSSPGAALAGSPRPSDSAAASGSPRPYGSAAPAASPAPSGPQGLVDGPLVDFDAAFDPSGTHLAVWIANPADPSIGSLTLYMLADGAWQLDPLHQLVGVPALRGFAIGAGELVWVTPPDAAGQGSHIEVIGWTKDGFGTVRSVPGARLIVIR